MKLIPYLVFIVIYYIVRAAVIIPTNRSFYLTFLNVGQGDSIVIHSPGYGSFMVDTGFNYQANYLSARRTVFPICHLKSVFITHYDSDHAGGLDRIERYCRDIKIQDNLSLGDRLDLGSVTLQVLSPARKNSSHEENDDSLVMLLSYGGFKAMLTGDVGTNVLEIAFSEVTDRLDVYKVSHHGSKYNTSMDIITKLQPKICVVPVGRNTFGHPSPDVLQYLTSGGCKVYRTDLDGTIVLY